MVSSDLGISLTRDGRFQLTPDGQLVTARGEAVLNPSGSPIYVPGNADELMIDEFGGISDAFGFIDQIGLYDVENLDDMAPLGPGRFSAQGARPAEDASIQQSMLEGANVDPVEGMTDLITLQRHFDAMQRLIQTHRDLDRRSVKLGAVNG
jgi:flagellar basal body rod protein FlgG